MKYKLGQHNSLKIKSEDWNFDLDIDPEKLEKEMIDFMIENRGIGLAANQIGLTKRMFVMGSKNDISFPRPMGLFNPKILEKSQNQILDKEGCLSYPGLWLTIKRPEWIIVSYQDSKGILKETRFEGYASKCFQHELDHLDGICFIDKVSQMKLNLAMKKLRKSLND